MPSAKRKPAPPRSATTPKQARSQKTLERLLEAAEKLFLERSPRDVSVAEIAKAAGSSVGGFYARFSDKDALLRALQERRNVAIQAELEGLMDPERWKGVPLEMVVRLLLGELGRKYAERRRLIAAFVSAAAQDPEGWEDSVKERERTVEMVVDTLVPAYADQIAHPDPERAVRFATHVAFATADTYAFRANLDTPAFGSIDDLVEELTRMYLAYLMSPGTDLRGAK